MGYSDLAIQMSKLTRCMAPPCTYPDMASGDDDDEDGVITKDSVEAAIRQLAGVVPKRDLAFVVSAFDVPRIIYDPVTKRLYEDTKQKTLLPTAEVHAQPFLGLATSRGHAAA